MAGESKDKNQQDENERSEFGGSRIRHRDLSAWFSFQRDPMRAAAKRSGTSKVYKGI